MELTFEIRFSSDFHIGAGHGIGLTVDSALHRDPDGVPVIRGSILTGLLRENLAELLACCTLSSPYLQATDHYRSNHIRSGGGFGEPPYCGQFESTPSGECPLCTIFGSPRRPKAWQISSARPVGLSQPQSRGRGGQYPSWRVGATAAQVTTRARVSPRTRRIERGKLFSRRRRQW